MGCPVRELVAASHLEVDVVVFTVDLGTLGSQVLIVDVDVIQIQVDLTCLCLLEWLQ